ncbi:hypothetical protein [Nonomuraea sp. NPDC002799]
MIARIAEAEREGYSAKARTFGSAWLAAAEGKLTQLDDLAACGTTLHLRMSHFSHVVGCTIAGYSP